MKNYIPLLVLTLMSYQIHAQNVFPDNGDVVLRGKSIKIERPNTTGGWARGTSFYQFEDINTRIAGYGLLGTASKPTLLYLAHGKSPWSSGLGVYVRTNGNVGIGTTSPNGPLHVADSNDAIATFQTLDNKWLYTNWLNSSGKRKAYMGLNSGLTSFILGLENGTQSFTIPNGNVGIGTSTPIAKLQINAIAVDSDISKNSITNTLKTSTQNNVTSYDKAMYSGLISYKIPAGITDSGYKIGVDASAYSGYDVFAGTLQNNFGVWARAGLYKATAGARIKYAIAVNAEILTNASGTTIDNAIGVKINTGANGAAKVKNRYDLYAGTANAKNYFAGSVGIGTLKPDEKLTVKGKIHTQEVRVDLDGVIAPDYVFEKYYLGESSLKMKYTMPTLEELEVFTKKNHHLPDIPSSKEMENNGIQLKEMNLKLLQKIEELTLYTIQQEHKIQLQEEKNRSLENRLEKIETLINDSNN